MTKQGEENSSLSWTGILEILWQSRKFIGFITGGVTVLALIISFILPEYFKSTAILLPDTDKSKIASIGSMADIAALAGVNVGSDVPLVKLYPTIITSESVLKNVIYAKYKTTEYPDSVNLIQYWNINEKNPERDFEVALLNLRTGLQISIENKTSVISMALETREPQLSADILNNVIHALEINIRTKRNTNASEKRKWIEARLVEVKEDLSKSENTLKDFREKNRVVSGSPQLLLQQERLVREMEINSTMYVELKKQFELAKIEEIRTTPILNVLDYARPAAKKEHPKKAVITLLSMIIALIGTGSYCIIEYRYSKDLSGWYKKFRGLN